MYVQDNEMLFAGLQEDALIFAGFGAAKRDGVETLQKLINEFASEREAGYSKVSEDGEYGGCTHATLKLLHQWYTALGGKVVFAQDSGIIDEQGPKAIASMLTGILATNKLSLSDLEDIQAGYEDWVGRGSPACGAGSDKPPATTSLSDYEETITPSVHKAGLGAIGWFLIGLAAVGAIGAGYWYFTRPATG